MMDDHRECSFKAPTADCAVIQSARHRIEAMFPTRGKQSRSEHVKVDSKSQWHQDHSNCTFNQKAGIRIQVLGFETSLGRQTKHSRFRPSTTWRSPAASNLLRLTVSNTNRGISSSEQALLAFRVGWLHRPEPCYLSHWLSGFLLQDQRHISGPPRPTEWSKSSYITSTRLNLSRALVSLL